jgi:hypothetical protein
MYLLFAVTICTAFSFVPRMNSTIKEINNTGDSKYYYFRVATDNGYYFSNVFKVDDNGTGTFKGMDKMREKFKVELKSYYGLDWPSSNITYYENYTQEAAENDRKNRISRAGDNVKYINL